MILPSALMNLLRMLQVSRLRQDRLLRELPCLSLDLRPAMQCDAMRCNLATMATTSCAAAASIKQKLQQTAANFKPGQASCAQKIQKQIK